MKVADINWDSWHAEMFATLLFVVKNDQVLLIRKKRGLGAGKINGPGGKIDPGETPMACAIRETQEELMITPLNVQARGQLFFHAEDMPRIHGYIFTATDYQGTPTETDEAIPLWTRTDQIPFDEMWDDDRLWLPDVLRGRCINGWFTFVGERMLDYSIEVVDALKNDV
jgi:8-oxo-dGTP diphosphatase